MGVGAVVLAVVVAVVMNDDNHFFKLFIMGITFIAPFKGLLERVFQDSITRLEQNK